MSSPPEATRDPSTLRSARWLDAPGVSGFIHRSSLRSEGLSSSAIGGRPVIGICNPWSELVNCNLHFRGLAEAVRRGVLAGGRPAARVPDDLARREPHEADRDALSATSMAMDVEECIRAYPLDAVVLLARLRQDRAGAADGRGQRRRAGDHGHRRPGRAGALPRPRARRRHRPLALRRGRARRPDDAGRVRRARGALNALGAATATRWAPPRRWRALVEALGMTLPGNGRDPGRRRARALRAGRGRGRARGRARARGPAAVADPHAPRRSTTRSRVLHGASAARPTRSSTCSRSPGAPASTCRSTRFDEIVAPHAGARERAPVGRAPVRGLLPRRRRAGAVLHELAAAAAHRRADRDRPHARRERSPGAVHRPTDVIAPLATPLSGPRADSRCCAAASRPTGAVHQASAPPRPRLLRIAGPAVVFEDVYDLARPHRRSRRSTSTADSVLVLRNAGPKGGPGMPEWGMLPIPRKLLERGVQRHGAHLGRAHERHGVRHGRPARRARGGGRRAARAGPGRRHRSRSTSRRAGSTSTSPTDELARRRARLEPRAARTTDAATARSSSSTSCQADEGCDFDFLGACPTSPPRPSRWGSSRAGSAAGEPA